jgi:hypothetical protein
MPIKICAYLVQSLTNIEDFYPSEMSFGIWYRRWLKKALRMLENERLVDKLVLGMTKEEVVAVVGGDWKERKNLYAPKYYLESPEIPAQLELSEEDGRVTKIDRWPFISARP